MIERIEEEIGCKATVVATGGLAKSIIPHCKREVILDEELMLKGLYIIYEKINSKEIQQKRRKDCTFLHEIM